jgi:hypothetical protein
LKRYIIILIFFPLISFSQLTHELKFEYLEDYYAIGAKSMTFTKKPIICNEISKSVAETTDSVKTICDCTLKPDVKQETATVTFGKNDRFEIIDIYSYQSSQHLHLQHDSLVFYYSSKVPYKLPTKIDFYRPGLNPPSNIRLENHITYFSDQDSLTSTLTDVFRGGYTYPTDYYLINDSSELATSWTNNNEFFQYYYSEFGDLQSKIGYHASPKGTIADETTIFYYNPGKVTSSIKHIEYGNSYSITKTFYNQLGQKSKIEVYRYSGKHISTSEIHFTYDQKGNWIKKIRIDKAINGKSGFIAEREIKY